MKMISQYINVFNFKGGIFVTIYQEDANIANAKGKNGLQYGSGEMRWRGAGFDPSNYPTRIL
jgi:hypothetical protein